MKKNFINFINVQDVIYTIKPLRYHLIDKETFFLSDVINFTYFDG